MYTDKEFTEITLKIIGDSPYTWAKNKGVKRTVIDQIKKGMPGLKTLYTLSKALNISIDTLIGEGGLSEKIATLEEQKGIDKLLDVLRGKDEDLKKMVKIVIDTASAKEYERICALGPLAWAAEGYPERRRVDRPVETERRVKSCMCPSERIGTKKRLNGFKKSNLN
jgi:hypothetical protein